MPPIPIVPRFKLMVKFDVRPDQYERYYRYLLGEFIPGLQNMQLYPFMVWHTAYGDYPMRQVEFVAESLEIVRTAFEQDRWQVLEEGLKEHTLNYERKVVHFQDRFQF